MNRKLSVSLIGLVGLFAAHGQAFATDPIYTGGGTLASRVYRDIFDCYGTKLPGYLPQISGTTCGNVSTEFFYAPVGSGAGQRAFLNHDSGSSTTTGLGTPASSNTVPYSDPSGTYPYPSNTLSFSGSDAQFTATQLSTYSPSPATTTSDQAKYGNAKQIPMFIAPVAIPFNSGVTNAASDTFNHTSSGLSQPADGTATLTLSANSLCGIFTGNITNWNDSSLTTDNGGVALVSSSTPIKIVIRSDGSGTTELMSRYLTANCPATVGGTSYPFHYTGTIGTSSAAAFNQLLANNSSNVIQSSGSGGVQTSIKNTSFSIGYVSADFAQQLSSGGVVLIGGDPNGPVSANVINRTSGFAYAASINNASSAMSSATAPNGTDDSAADWGQPSTGEAGNPADFYPIVGFTFLEAYTCYASNATATDLSAFFNWYTSTGTGNNGGNNTVAAILNSHGFAELPFAYESNLNTLLVTNSATALAHVGAASSTACASGVSPGA